MSIIWRSSVSAFTLKERIYTIVYLFLKLKKKNGDRDSV